MLTDGIFLLIDLNSLRRFLVLRRLLFADACNNDGQTVHIVIEIVIYSGSARNGNCGTKRLVGEIRHNRSRFAVGKLHQRSHGIRCYLSDKRPYTLLVKVAARSAHYVFDSLRGRAGSSVRSLRCERIENVRNRKYLRIKVNFIAL